MSDTPDAITTLLANLAKTKIAQDPVPEPIVVQSRYLQNAFEQIAEELATDVPQVGPPQFIPVVDPPNWAANAGLAYRTLDGGASIQISGVLSRNTAANFIPPGLSNSVWLCTLPIRPVLAQQIAVVSCLANVLPGAQPQDSLDFGFILFSSPGIVTFYGHAPVNATTNGTNTIYVTCIFSLTLPNTPFMADMATEPDELAPEPPELVPWPAPADVEPAAAEPPPTLHRDATEENADGSTHVKEDEENAFDWRRAFGRLLALLAELWVFLYDRRPWAKVRASIDPAPAAPGTWPTNADDRGPATEVQHGP